MQNSPLALACPMRGTRPVMGAFDGGNLTSDAGLLLVSGADRQSGLTRVLAGALRERRQRAKGKHPRLTLLREGVFALALGYEDANDLDPLRTDPALLVACPPRPRERTASRR
jgi:DDE family transposase